MVKLTDSFPGRYMFRGVTLDGHKQSIVPQSSFDPLQDPLVVLSFIWFPHF